MYWIAPSEKDTGNAALEKRLGDAADQFRANSGLNSQEYSAPVLGLIFLRFPEVRFATQRTKRKSATRMLIGILCLISTALSAVGESGLCLDGRGELLLRGVPFRGIGVNYYDAFTRMLGQTARTNYDAGFRELAAKRIPFARFSAGGYWPLDWGLYQTNRSEYFARLDGVVQSAARHGIGLIPSFFWDMSTVPDLVG